MELLIKAIDAASDDPVKDAATYKRGDVFVVKPDGWDWSVQEKGGAFFVVKIPGVPEDAFPQLEKSEVLELTYALVEPDVTGRLPVATEIMDRVRQRSEEILKRSYMLSRRVFKVDTALFTPEDLLAIDKEGFVEKTEADLKQLVISKIDGSKLP